MRVSCFVALLVLATVACSDGSPPRGDGGACVPGAAQACACSDGASGTQICNASGSGLDSCACASPECAATCSGCCEGMTCRNGLGGRLCGFGGDACVNCPAGTSCSAGACITDPIMMSGCSVRDRFDGTYEDTCAANQICDCGGTVLCEGTGTCMDPFGRWYRIEIHGGEFAPNKIDGSCWDGPGCGAPDGFVVVTVDDIVLGRTSTASNLYFPFWIPSETFETTIVAGSTAQLVLWDEDLVDHDLGLICTAAALTAGILRSRSVSCSAGLFRLDARIFPL